MKELWHWIGALPPGAGTFLGTLVGSSLGLVALLVGALFNAYLNRRRDDRLRRDDAEGLRTAIRAELESIRDTLIRNADGLADGQSGYVIPDVAHSMRVLPELLSKLTLLGAEEIRTTIEAHVVVDQFCETLILIGGVIVEKNRDDRRLIEMPKGSAPKVARTLRRLASRLDPAIVALGGEASSKLLDGAGTTGSA